MLVATLAFHLHSLTSLLAKSQKNSIHSQFDVHEWEKAGDKQQIKPNAININSMRTNQTNVVRKMMAWVKSSSNRILGARKTALKFQQTADDLRAKESHQTNEIEISFFISTRSTRLSALIAATAQYLTHRSIGNGTDRKRKENTSIALPIDRIIGFVNKFNPTIVHNLCVGHSNYMISKWWYSQMGKSHCTKYGHCLTGQRNYVERYSCTNCVCY